MTDILAILLQIMSDGSLTIVAEPVKTTIEECLKMALEVNNSDMPYLLMCAPDLSLLGA